MFTAGTTRRMAIANGMCISFCNQPKAHFGLPWLRTWDNRGKFHMDENRIQCLSNTLQHVPIYPKPFPSNSTRKFNLAHFLHILAYPGYDPGTIMVNVTWMERGFNAGQTHSSIYPSIFNRLRAIARYWSEIATFFLPPLHLMPCWGCSHWNSGKSLVLRKLESWGYQEVKTVWR